MPIQDGVPQENLPEVFEVGSTGSRSGNSVSVLKDMTNDFVGIKSNGGILIFNREEAMEIVDLFQTALAQGV